MLIVQPRHLPHLPQSFTYLNLAAKMEPWFKGHGQQDTGMSPTDLLEGHRVSKNPKKDPRFPDYHKAAPGMLAESFDIINSVF